MTSLAEVTAGPAQRPGVVECNDFTVPVAEVAVDAQRFLKVPGRARPVPERLPHAPHGLQGAGLAGPVAEVAVDTQRAAPVPYG